MTGLAAIYALYEARFHAIPDETVEANLGDLIIEEEADGTEEAEESEENKEKKRKRRGEAARGVPAVAQLRAIYRTRLFWVLAAMLPRNDLSVRHLGRRQHYPDWLLFLLECIASLSGVATRHAAITVMSDPVAWAAFVYDVDRYVPPGMTKLRDAPTVAPRKDRAQRTLADPQTETHPDLASLVPEAAEAELLPVPALQPPAMHHITYSMDHWRGYQGGKPVSSAHPWYGLRRRIIERFRELAVEQAQMMGLLDYTNPFQRTDPNPLNFVGVDGVVFPQRKGHSPAAAMWGVGGEPKPIYGSKFTIFSIRIVGQYLSRVILDFSHTGTSPDSLAKGEAGAVRIIAPILQALAREQEASPGFKHPREGLHGITVDGAIVGETVTQLQRHGIVVANYPTALSNPDGKSGHRHPETRKEKSHLRTIARHPGIGHQSCDHVLFLFGAHLVEMVTDADGDDQLRTVEIARHRRYRNKDRTWRDYFIAKIVCEAHGNFEKRVALFHTDPNSDDPVFNYGEYARVLPPHTPEFRKVYFTRNDTESRHADLKARLKHFPKDVARQELRLLGAAVAINALALHVHRQAHRQANAIDNTG